jgi:uncharacterized membrane protein YfcA
MDMVVIAVVAALASALTLYSGFGLGTILLPAFALFFPATVAVAATGVVHLLNNIFKAGLLWRQADWRVVRRFGLAAAPAALAGAWLLARLGDTPQLFQWQAFGRHFGPSGAGLTVGLLLLLFAGLELQAWFQKLAAPPRLMPLGGLLTGFFGGLTGQQGALRSIFLLRAGLEPKAFIATGVMIAIIVDLARLATYGAAFSTAAFDPAGRQGQLVLTGTLTGFVGAWTATRFLDKVTIAGLRTLVAALMAAIGLAMCTGLIG